LDLVNRLQELLVQAKNVAVHCRQGIGRSALIIAGLLVSAGMTPEAALERVSVARGQPVPETPEQRRWVVNFAREVSAYFSPTQ
jgi:protein-tyrosine phosphatase